MNRIAKIIHSAHPQLADTSILLVGVGGIGCEILKALGKMEIGGLHILDMDTIEVCMVVYRYLI